MANDSAPYMTALDAIATENHLQMIKAAIPYINLSEQKFVSVYVKYLELMNTVSFFKVSDKNDMKACSLSADSNSPLDMLTDIRDYCNDDEKDSIDVFINILNGYQLYQTYRETSDSESENSSAGPMDALKAFLTPEQQSMIDTYSMLLNT
jgi:hypothetical protein